MTLSALFGFLDIGAPGSSDVSWLCVIQSDDPQDAPEITVQRLNKKQALDQHAGKLTLSEGNPNGGTASGNQAQVTLKLTGTPITRGNLLNWEVKLSARAGGDGITFVLSGRAKATDPFAQLATQSATSLQRPQINANSAIVQQLKESPVPRLSLGINQANPLTPPATYKKIPPPIGGADASTVINTPARNLQALLYRIFWLLDAPSTLDAMWDQQALTLTADSLSDSKMKTDPVRVAEELWARQVTEMLSFTPYGGPAANYGEKVTDFDLISTGIDKDATDPHYGLFFACQHLANFGVVSRGFQTLPKGIELNAGAQCAATVMNMRGQWLNGVQTVTPLAAATSDPAALTNGPTSVNLTQIMKDPLYGPGSVHLFSNRPAHPNNPVLYQKLNTDVANKVLSNGTACAIVTGSTSKGTAVPTELCITANGPIVTRSEAVLTKSPSTSKLFVADNTESPEVPHLGFVLRVRSTGVQVFDTGGFGVQGRPQGVTALNGTAGVHSGNFDDPLTQTINGAHPFRGTGTFPLPTAANAQTLHDHVRNVLQQARPIGLARLVLLNRSQLNSSVDASTMTDTALLGAIVYASPLTTMYLPDANEPLSNYSIPRYMWSLRNLPGAAQVQAVWMLYVPLGLFAKQLLSSARSVTAANAAKAVFGASFAAALPSAVNPIADVLSDTAGKVLVIGGGGRTKPHALHRLENRGRLPMSSTFPASVNPANFPPYFLG